MIKEDNNVVEISLEKLEVNKGQLEGLPENPREMTEREFKLLKANIRKYPKLLNKRGLLVYPLENGNYIIIGGNMRYEALKELKYKSAPCQIIEKETDIETLKAYTLIENKHYGKWDWDAIANQWEELQLEEIGIDLPIFDNSNNNDTFVNDKFNENEEEEATEVVEEKDEKVEAMICDAVKKASNEVVEQFDKLQGFSFITPHTAKIDFIKFCHYNKEYFRYNSLAFHKQQFVTNGDCFSVYEGLKNVHSGKTKAERLRFVIDDKFSNITRGSLAFSGARMPLDFPASLSKELINEFCKEGGAVLDPCSGWGGRLVGFLASCASSYEGVDASPLQVEGDLKIFETFKDCTKEEKSVKITCSPFEKYEAGKERFDFALTSPPYFDTEKYLGGEQSHATADNYTEWRETFYKVLIKKVFEALKHDCFFALQVGSQSYPLLEDGKEIAQQIGFKVVDVRTTDMKNHFNKTEDEKGEVVLLLYKE